MFMVVLSGRTTARDSIDDSSPVHPDARTSPTATLVTSPSAVISREPQPEKLIIHLQYTTHIAPSAWGPPPNDNYARVCTREARHLGVPLPWWQNDATGAKEALDRRGRGRQLTPMPAGKFAARHGSPGSIAVGKHAGRRLAPKRHR